MVFDVELSFFFLGILTWYNKQTNERLTENEFPWIGRNVEEQAIAKPGSTAFSTISQFIELQGMCLSVSLFDFSRISESLTTYPHTIY